MRKNEEYELTVNRGGVGFNSQGKGYEMKRIDGLLRNRNIGK